MNSVLLEFLFRYLTVSNHVTILLTMFLEPKIWHPCRMFWNEISLLLATDFWDVASKPPAISNWKLFSAGIYLLKVNNRNTRTRCEICSKLTIHQNDDNGVILVSLLLTLNIFTPCSSVSIVNFQHVIAGWVSKEIEPISHQCSISISSGNIRK